MKNLEDCIKNGIHLTDCDNDGFCNHCGHQDEFEDEEFEIWWFNKGGLDIAIGIYQEQAEKNISVNLNERIIELYGEHAIGDKGAENNVFIDEVEMLARENKLHLK